MSTAPPESRKKLSAKAFSSCGIWCPHCSLQLGEEHASCPQCGFRLDACSEILGTQAPELDFLIDPGGILPPETGEKLTPHYQRLQRHFPQLALCLCFVELNPPLKPNELAFWLMNVAPEPTSHRAWTISIVFEVARHEAGLSPGYAIEPFLKPDPWSTLLGQVCGQARQDGWVPALETLIMRIHPLLDSARKQAVRRARKITSKVEK